MLTPAPAPSPVLVLPPPQRVVTISLTTFGNAKVGKAWKARYTYVSPVTGECFQNSPTCNLKVTQATKCLFVLDFLSTQAGWTITKITRNGTTLIPALLGPDGLSLMTSNPFLPDLTTNSTTVYKFFIWYENKVTGDHYHEDPQESNGPPAPNGI